MSVTVRADLAENGAQLHPARLQVSSHAVACDRWADDNVLFVRAARPRKETAALQEQLAELQLKVKALMVQTRLASQAEIKILLTKVDAVYNQIAQLERAHGEAQEQIQTLELTKRNHQKKLGSMVPGTDLEVAKGDLAQKADLVNSLHKRLQESQEEIDKLTRAMQVRGAVKLLKRDAGI
jgi:valyl-tRNA synthetase